MRREPYSVGSYVHIMKRGTRGLPITRDDDDRWRFLKLMRYLNDENVPRNWEREIGPAQIQGGFLRPNHWSDSKPYVSILSFCLMDNHFHLLVQEREEGGISSFMQRLCTSMATYFNAKYQEKGTLFQSSYNARTVTNDSYLRYLIAYIAVKNPLERREGGLTHALKEYESAIGEILTYPFSSLPDHVGQRSGSITDSSALKAVYPFSSTRFLRDAQEMLQDVYLSDEEFRRLAMEDIDDDS